jgi:hypothetical protein
MNSKLFEKVFLVVKIGKIAATAKNVIFTSMEISAIKEFQLLIVQRLDKLLNTKKLTRKK